MTPPLPAVCRYTYPRTQPRESDVSLTWEFKRAFLSRKHERERFAALAGLIIQGPVGFGGAVFYSFSFNVGPGFWLVLLGFVVMTAGTFLNRSLQIHA
jgi:hypothetical protein